MVWKNFSANATLQEIIKERRADTEGFTRLDQQKLKGRDRTGVRAVPADAADVEQGDIAGDRLNDDTYKYELMTTSTGLKWDRRTLNTSW